MDYLLVTAASLLVAALTLFSGFGLGTLLMPVFAIFFPVEVAIAATAVVHLANNLFKLALVGRWARRDVVVRFGAPAIVAAFAGALLLAAIAGLDRPLARYDLGPREATITPLKLTIAALIAAFSLLELWPRLERLEFSPRLLPLGGALSGFFGGLSGHQGALRAAFLIRAGLTREQFIGTAAVVSVLVDLTRLAVYIAGLGLLATATDYTALRSRPAWGLVAAASLAAFAGSFIGSRLVRKVTLRGLQRLVGALLLVLAAALALGVV